MQIRTLLLTSAFTSLLLGTVCAQNSKIEGIVTDTNGRPLANIQVRIQQVSTNSPALVVKTNAKGHFVAESLPVASYNVAVLVNSAAKISAARVKTERNQTTLVNLGGKQIAATAVPQKKRRAVWVQTPTGTHMGGHYEDAPDPTDRGTSANNVEGMSSEALRRLQNVPQKIPSTGGR